MKGDYSDNEKEIVTQLNQKLKTLTTYEEFKAFQKEMDSYELGLCLYGKRRGYVAYSFHHMYDNDGYINNPFAGLDKWENRVDYLYDDSVSTGQSYIKNLWKVLEVR